MPLLQKTHVFRPPPPWVGENISFWQLLGVFVGNESRIHGRYKQKQTRETRVFFAIPYAGRFGWLLMDLKPNMANFPPTVWHFWGGKKNPNSQKEISVVNSEFFFCQTKNVLRLDKSSPCWVSGPPKTTQIGPHREWQKNAEVGHSH